MCSNNHWTPLHYEIDEKTIKKDRTELLRPIESRLKLLRDGNRMGTSLLSDEERRLVWNLGFVLAVKYHEILVFLKTATLTREYFFCNRKIPKHIDYI